MLAYENFVFVLGSDKDYKMGTFVNEECFLQPFLSKNMWPNAVIQETSLEAHIRGVMNRFVRTGSVNKEKSPARPSVSEEVVDDLRRIKISSAVPVAK